MNRAMRRAMGKNSSARRLQSSRRSVQDTSFFNWKKGPNWNALPCATRSCNDSIQGNITDFQRSQFRTALQRFGLYLMEDRKSILIERVKNVVVEMVYSPEVVRNISFSDFIARRLHYHYTYLSNIFSKSMGITIEQYFIANKIERAKELIFNDELNLTEISFMLNYSSVAHLSGQFKKITGLTPTQFKKLKEKRRIGLDEI